MFFMKSGQQGPDPAQPRRRRQWTGMAALLACGAGMVIFALSMLFIFTPDPSQRVLDEVTNLMAAGNWQAAADLCRRRLAEHAAGATQPARAKTASGWRSLMDGETELNLRLGICLSMQEKYDDARQVFDDAIGRHPDEHRLVYNRALVEYRSANLDDALSRLRKLAEQAPYYPNVHYHIGRIYETKGLYDQALEAYRNELNISSSAGAWQRYLVMKKMRGATTSRPAG